MAKVNKCGCCKRTKTIRGICHILVVKKPAGIEVKIVALCEECGKSLWNKLQELKGASFIRRR